MKKLNFKFESAEKADFIKSSINDFLDKLQLFVVQNTDNDEDEIMLAFEMSEMFTTTFFVYVLIAAFGEDSVEQYEDSVNEMRKLLIKTLSNEGHEVH